MAAHPLDDLHPRGWDASRLHTTQTAARAAPPSPSDSPARWTRSARVAWISLPCGPDQMCWWRRTAPSCHRAYRRNGMASPPLLGRHPLIGFRSATPDGGPRRCLPAPATAAAARGSADPAIPGPGACSRCPPSVPGVGRSVPRRFLVWPHQERHPIPARSDPPLPPPSATAPG